MYNYISTVNRQPIHQIFLLGDERWLHFGLSQPQSFPIQPQHRSVSATPGDIPRRFLFNDQFPHALDLQKERRWITWGENRGCFGCRAAGALLKHLVGGEVTRDSLTCFCGWCWYPTPMNMSFLIFLCSALLCHSCLSGWSVCNYRRRFSLLFLFI